jgi:hypothetical protein
MLFLGGALISQVQAGILFSKKPAGNPNERVPELIVDLQNNGDEEKRINAAAELRLYDTVQFPDIVPVLIHVLINDANPSVRAEAAASLSKIRPVTTEIKITLENAMKTDASLRVRIQARTSLLQYNLAGFRTPQIPASNNQSVEPPTIELAPNSEPVQLKPTAQLVAPTKVVITSNSSASVPSFFKSIISKPTYIQPAQTAPELDNTILEVKQSEPPLISTTNSVVTPVVPTTVISSGSKVMPIVPTSISNSASSNVKIVEPTTVPSSSNNNTPVAPTSVKSSPGGNIPASSFLKSLISKPKDNQPSQTELNLNQETVIETTIPPAPVSIQNNNVIQIEPTSNSNNESNVQTFPTFNNILPTKPEYKQPYQAKPASRKLPDGPQLNIN